jgi:predicted porin
MQKKLIALAIAGIASSGVFAQTNVTVYGVADVGLVNATASQANGNASLKKTGVDPAPSGSTTRLGFKGVEDLGNGLKALFVLEYGFTPDAQNSANGTAAAVGNQLTSRQTYVGLAGGFGAVVGGFLQTPMYDWAVKYYANTSSNYGASQMVSTAINGTASGSDRLGNAVAWIHQTGLVSKSRLLIRL